MALDTIRTILERRSIRSYKPERMPDEDLRAILEAGRQAPSGGNRQPWHFVVVKEASLKEQVATACSGQLWMAQAGVVIAAVGLPAAGGKFFLIDTAIALQNMILAAHSLGYGTCWIGSFDEAKVKELLGVPGDARVVCLTPVGVPAEAPEARPRKQMAEVFSLDRYGQPLA